MKDAVGVNVVMMGPPGAGKGTQAERFAEAHGVPKISTGDILRDEMKGSTPLGQKAREEMDRGELVDDATVIDIVRKRLGRSDTREGFVLDGFPRTVVQARALDAIMDERGDGPLVVVDVVVPRAELVRRVAGRRICGTCGTNASSEDRTCRRCAGELVQRRDDVRAVVDERLKVYERETRSLVAYYRGRPTFYTLDGAQTPDTVADALSMVIESSRVSVKSGSTVIDQPHGRQMEWKKPR